MALGFRFYSLKTVVINCSEHGVEDFSHSKYFEFSGSSCLRVYINKICSDQAHRQNEYMLVLPSAGEMCNRASHRLEK